MKIVIFDIDGTLLLSGGVGVYAFDRAFQELHDVRDAWDGYDPHGKTDPEIIDELSRGALKREVNPDEKKAIGERYVQYFAEGIDQAERFRLMPGAMELLLALTTRRNLLGIATGNFKETAGLKLKRAAMSHFFQFGGYGSDSHDRLTLTRLALERGLAKAVPTFLMEQISKNCGRHSPHSLIDVHWKMRAGKPYSTSDVILIGDARQDVECGKALGLRTIAVATGSKSVKELEALTPSLVLKNLSDFKRVLAFIDQT